MKSKYDKTVPVEVRFWNRVEKTIGCWWWLPSKKKNSRGYLRVNNVHTLVYRYSWVLHHGPIPDGLNVCHTCDNPACVKPGHLFLGTQADNLNDCRNKGRRNDESKGSKGTKNAACKLTEDIVRAIRKDAVTLSWAEIGRRYKISSVQARNIALRKSWNHVE